VLTGNEERWANLASLRIFNKSFDALMDDYDKTIGGIPSDTLASLIELGKEIEAADASPGQLGSALTPPARRRRVTQFQMLVVGVLALAVVAGLWVTRWAYCDQMISSSVTHGCRRFPPATRMIDDQTAYVLLVAAVWFVLGMWGADFLAWFRRMWR